MWYFPIIPRLQRLFQLESISEDLRWGATRRITDGVLCYLADSQAWRTIDEKLLEIAKDLRNLRLGISADGVDVNSGTRHHKPLVDDLHTLFETGVDTYDASTKENFNLCAAVLRTINDYLALGTLCGCPYSGFKEKNVGESLVGTLLNVPGKIKDGMNARLDLAELGIKPELFTSKTTLPPTGYTLTNAKKDIFYETLCNIKVPQGYCSNFSSLVSLKDMKLIGLKSHDYHMLMQEFLPIAIRSTMHPPTRYAMIRFCFFFKSICRKEISLQKLDKMQEELVVTLCLLEKFFPPSFFDIMIHLTVHLTREVKLCGLICFRRHKQVLKTKNPGKRIALLENDHSKSFSKWLCEEVERELAISKGSVSETIRRISYEPRATIVKYEANNINGYTLRTKSNDVIVYKNCENLFKLFFAANTLVKDFNLSINCLLHVGIKTLFDAVRVTASHICVNAAQLELVLLMNFKEKICQVFTTVSIQLMPLVHS
nr:hypothetical protein [Tanacetum cinerariifolium]